MQLNIFTTAMEGEPQGELCWPQQAICASFFSVSSIITPEGEKNKNRRAHYRTHDITVPSPLTINPGYSNAFKECNPQKAHTTGCIVVKELKHIHATLEEKRKGKDSGINYRFHEVEGKTFTEIEQGNKTGRVGVCVCGGGISKALPQNAGTRPTEAEFNRCRDVIEARLTAPWKRAFRIVPFKQMVSV